MRVAVRGGEQGRGGGEGGLDVVEALRVRAEHVPVNVGVDVTSSPNAARGGSPSGSAPAGLGPAQVHSSVYRARYICAEPDGATICHSHMISVGDRDGCIWQWRVAGHKRPPGRSAGLAEATHESAALATDVSDVESSAGGDFLTDLVAGAPWQQ